MYRRGSRKTHPGPGAGLAAQHKHMRRLTVPNPNLKLDDAATADNAGAADLCRNRRWAWHDDVNMIFVMLFVLGKGLAGLMIELDQQHRAMDAVIETLSSSTPPTLLMGGLSAAASGEKFNVLDFTVLSERKCESKAERRLDR